MSTAKLGPDDALEQISYLRDLIDATRLRAASGWFSYLCWGIAWTLGYVATAWTLYPHRLVGSPPKSLAADVWGVVLIGAFVATGLFGHAVGDGRRLTTLARQLVWLNAIAFAAVFAFWLLAGLSFGHTVFVAFGRHAQNSYWPFWIGVLYLLNGIFLGSELYAIGGWLIAASVLGLVMPPWVQALWLAFAGGGGLVATGILFRRQLHTAG